MSNEEKFFLDWLNELEQVGLASGIKYQPKTYDLADPVIIGFDKKLKTKTKTIEKTILQPVTYTPDFEFNLSSEVADILYNGESFDSPLFIKLPDQHKFIVDTKGTFTGRSNASDISAPIKIKWVYQKYKEYVQLVKPFGGLFDKTFYPKTYFTLDSGKPRRKKVKGELVDICTIVKDVDTWLNKNNII